MNEQRPETTNLFGLEFKPAPEGYMVTEGWFIGFGINSDGEDVWFVRTAFDLDGISAAKLSAYLQAWHRYYANTLLDEIEGSGE